MLGGAFPVRSWMPLSELWKLPSSNACASRALQFDVGDSQFLAAGRRWELPWGACRGDGLRNGEMGLYVLRRLLTSVSSETFGRPLMIAAGLSLTVTGSRACGGRAESGRWAGRWSGKGIERGNHYRVEGRMRGGGRLQTVARSIAQSSGSSQDHEGYEDLGRYGLDEFQFGQLWTPPPADNRPLRYEGVGLYGAAKVARKGRRAGPREGGGASRRAGGIGESAEGRMRAKRGGRGSVNEFGSRTVEREREMTGEHGSGGEEEDEGSGSWCVYLLLAGDGRKTYVGVTTDLDRRLKQHNGDVVGGAKSTRAGRPWSLLCTVGGFYTRSEAFQFEWRWKNPRAKNGDGSMDRYSETEQDATLPPQPSAVRRSRAALEEALKSFPHWQLHVDWLNQG